MADRTENWATPTQHHVTCVLVLADGSHRYSSWGDRVAEWGLARKTAYRFFREQLRHAEGRPGSRPVWAFVAFGLHTVQYTAGEIEELSEQAEGVSCG